MLRAGKDGNDICNWYTRDPLPSREGEVIVLLGWCQTGVYGLSSTALGGCDLAVTGARQVRAPVHRASFQRCPLRPQTLSLQSGVPRRISAIPFSTRWNSSRLVSLLNAEKDFVDIDVTCFRKRRMEGLVAASVHLPRFLL
jgi:hypothetical protein